MVTALAAQQQARTLQTTAAEQGPTPAAARPAYDPAPLMVGSLLVLLFTFVLVVPLRGPDR